MKAGTTPLTGQGTLQRNGKRYWHSTGMQGAPRHLALVSSSAAEVGQGRSTTAALDVRNGLQGRQ